MKALVPWRSFGEVFSPRQDIAELFSHFFGEEWPESSGRFPTVESFIRDGEMVVRADLPGIDPKQIELTVDGHQLWIRGERKAEEKRDDKNFLYREVSYGRFERAIALPEGVDTGSIGATYHDGVLEVTIKAPKEMAARKVPISVH